MKNEFLVEKSKNGDYTIKAKKRYLHSKYDPRKEAKIFVENNKGILNKKNIIIYGLGLGYHIEEIIRISNGNSKIYVIELNTNIVQLCKKYNGKLFLENIKFIFHINEFRKINFDDVEDIAIHKPSLDLLKEQDFQLYNSIKNYSIKRNSIKSNSDNLKKNKESNLMVKHNPISSLLLKDWKKGFIIVSAGPSLDYSIEDIKKIKNEYTIITVGTATKTLLSNNIKPNIIVIIDGNELVKNQLHGIDEVDIPLCFLSTASRWAVKEYDGSKYIFFNDDNSKFEINTGKTVAVAAMDIAIKLGANEILMFGQDLAFLNGRTHIKDFENIYDKENVIVYERENPKVKSVNGKLLDTKQGYIYFKEQIENLINKNKDIRFINFSGGAFINGAKNIKFDEYFQL